jgi:mannosyl-3-phosphoglycerate phosphatase
MRNHHRQSGSLEVGAARGEGGSSRQLIIYSDLDGTLLEETTYSFAAARPALARIRTAGIPLVLCSSKTRAEIESLQRELRIHHPFIVENGGAIYLPRDPWRRIVAAAEPVGQWLRLELGVPYGRLLQVLAEIKRAVGLWVVGFSDLTPEEIAADCGLDLAAARRAKVREYDEPIKLLREQPDVLSTVRTIAARHHLQVTGGGRYLHLTGPNDKGRAATLLNDLFRRRYGEIFTVGLGDSVNDIPLLASVDYPYLVRRPDGRADDRVMGAVPGVTVTKGIGPSGWNEAVLELLARIDRGSSSRS